MLRWSGILAAVLTAVLLAILVKRTEVAVLAGTVDRGPTFVNEARLEQDNPGRGVVFVTSGSKEELRRYSEAGIASTMLGGTKGTDRKWMTFLPKEVAASLEDEDEIIFSVRWLVVDEGMESPYRLVRYQFRRGTTTWSAVEPDNWKFLLVYGLAGGGPLLAWGIGCGIWALAAAGRKPRAADFSEAR